MLTCRVPYGTRNIMTIKEFCKSKKISPFMFAKLANINSPNIYRYLNKTRVPSLRVSEKIIKFSEGQITLADLLDEKK